MSTSTSCTATTSDVPVGEFVDAMDAEVKAGRIRGPFGGSNWTRERLDAAIAYAEAHGQDRARRRSPTTSRSPRCSSRSGPAASRLGRRLEGVADRAGRCRTSPGRARAAASSPTAPAATSATTRSWCASGTPRRTSSAATGRSSWPEQLGKSPIHVALAYVLAQPFPAVPLIGPRTLVELDDSLKALAITLTPEEVRWLDSGRRQSSA